MRLLLDTHTFLWWCGDNSHLSLPAIDAIGNGENEVYLSVVSGWEIAIKSRIARLDLPEPPNLFVPRMVERHAFGVLPVAMKHALAEFDLPMNHNDPFDRLLVAQAKSEEMILVSNDKLVAKYDAVTLW